MKIILGTSGSGKTKRLLELSAINGTPILCESQARVERLLEKAKGYGYQIPLPIAYENFENSKVKEVYVDDVNVFLEGILGAKISASTINQDEGIEVLK